MAVQVVATVHGAQHSPGRRRISVVIVRQAQFLLAAGDCMGPRRRGTGSRRARPCMATIEYTTEALELRQGRRQGRRSCGPAEVGAKGGIPARLSWLSFPCGGSREGAVHGGRHGSGGGSRPGSVRMRRARGAPARQAGCGACRISSISAGNEGGQHSVGGGAMFLLGCVRWIRCEQRGGEDTYGAG
jgi:hypothetical protein